MIGFEVLHYQTKEDTIACVDSIIHNVKDCIVVIVDNGSTNLSFEQVERKYVDQSKVICIRSNDNLGFARGNNMGYKYLRDNYECDFICCINNDTQIIENDFVKKLEMVYKEYLFDVMGPKVVLRDGSIQSFNPHIHSTEYYEKELSVLSENESYIDYLRARNLFERLLNRFPHTMAKLRFIKQRIKKPYSRIMKDVVLHGCFLIFSTPYIEKFDTAFDSRTFMYREEELLYLRLKKNNMLSLYCEDICIRHMEDSSTNATYRDKETKYQFMRINQMESTEILLEELRNGGYVSQ